MKNKIILAIFAFLIFCTIGSISPAEANDVFNFGDIPLEDSTFNLNDAFPIDDFTFNSINNVPVKSGTVNSNKILPTKSPTFSSNDGSPVKLTGSKSSYGVNKNYKTPQVAVNTKKAIKITPKTNPTDDKISKYTTLNKYTKNYYTLMSIMTKFEKSGGGTVILTKGTYTITNSVAVPSNVNIILENGVTIKKGTKTGTSRFPAAKSMFQLVPPSKIQKNSVYGKYNGVSNVNIIGKGSSTFDLGYSNGAHGIAVGHNKNVKIQGITFKNLNGGHFIEVTASNKVSISNCKFLSSKASSKLKAEAINLDTPDKNTKGFPYVWSKQDRTPNKNVVIENNVFKNLDKSIGTHKYSQDKYQGKYVVNKGQRYHTGIVIKNNEITNMRADAICILNWKDSQIINNNIKNVPKNSNNYRGVRVTGVNISIKYNKFDNMMRPIQFLPIKNVNEGSMYSITYCTLTSQNENDLRYNLCSNLGEYYTRINNNLGSITSKRIPVFI
ncbi:MAG: hypothetical protein FWH29_02255 [Methanobrevibacter sp.]|nr:hypothetical protein [Methanobrevibacter sp.]